LGAGEEAPDCGLLIAECGVGKDGGGGGINRQEKFGALREQYSRSMDVYAYFGTFVLLVIENASDGFEQETPSCWNVTFHESSIFESNREIPDI
jgi:hypothetical protein